MEVETVASIQKFQFLPPDEARLKKSIKILLVLTIVSGAFLIPVSLSISRDDSFIASFVRTAPLILGLQCFSLWEHLMRQRHRAKFGRIEIDNNQVKVISGTENSLVIKFGEVEEFISDNGILEIHHRVKGRSKKLLITLAQLERPEEFVTALREKLVRGSLNYGNRSSTL